MTYIKARYRLHPPERKERAFQDQWIKLVFIGSKLERPREQSCGRFTLFREEGAHGLKKEAEEREWEICIAYRRQNDALIRKDGPLHLYEYSSYEHIDEKELFVALHVYNMSDRCKEKVTLEDVKKYLSSEFDEEGNLYVLNKNNKVHAYIEWYRKRVITDTGMDFEGEHQIERYWTRMK